ncbi:arabinofuranosyltransferase [Thermomonospora umbrina]|uniref:Arabinofuranosyltransferase-like protein n=1 Tax=Thermomonospora umbrina TaxID=111806 RepID=A0A3D9SRG4_9ACTN|nr:arabinofuranosyltransferase [Thermomonospora umbrina]REE96543.1 arabinofuranosyltransferase-like protein [Thermomonospora umbrina]
MTAASPTSEIAPGPPGAPGSPPDRRERGGRVASTLTHPAVVAVLTWAIVSPVAALLPGLADANPFRQQDAHIPLAIGGVIACAVAALALRGRTAVVSGLAAGLFAAYTVLVMRTALHGTPFAFEGTWSDTGRLSAMATRYTSTWGTSDGIVAGVPAEYPPLFPYLIGKASLLLDVPAWRLLQPAMIIATSAAVVASFCLWVRLVAAPVALAISALTLLAFPAPTKSYELVALAVTVPWLLMTVARPERGKLHWLPAGLIGALLFQWYFAYLVYSAPGVLALAWIVWRAADDRKEYLLHLAKVVGIVAVLSAWFLVPYLGAMLTGGQQVADMWDAPQASDNPLPFLSPTPLGVAQLVGLAGLVLYRRSTWWATPMLLILLGTYAYRVLNMLRWVTTGHTGLYYYADHLITGCLLMAAALTAATAAPQIAARLSRPAPRGAGVATLTALFVFAGFACWSAWMPANRWIPQSDNVALPDFGSSSGFSRTTRQAHVQKLPDLSTPRFAAEAAEAGRRSAMVPVQRIQREVERVYGPGATPRTLSYDEQLYSFLPWKGYVSQMRTAAAAPARFDERYAEVRRLAAVVDARRFAEQSRRTRFGPIDVFVLRYEGTDIIFRALQTTTTARFSPQQFDRSRFIVFENLPNQTFLAIRRPA